MKTVLLSLLFLAACKTVPVRATETELPDPEPVDPPGLLDVTDEQLSANPDYVGDTYFDEKSGWVCTAMRETIQCQEFYTYLEGSQP